MLALVIPVVPAAVSISNCGACLCCCRFGVEFVVVVSSTSSGLAITIVVVNKPDGELPLE